MAKNLLAITQEILNAMTGDEVNSITDTAEAEAVARIVISVFEGLVSNRNWPTHKQLFNLTSFADVNTPTHCSIPENMKELLSIRYNKRKTGSSRLYYEKVDWKEPDDFLAYTNRRDSTQTYNQTVTDPTGIKLIIRKDTHPAYFTSFNDDTIIFDSVDTEFDTTIQESQMQVYGYRMPSATFSDTWEPDLPMEAIKLLVEEAKSTARFQIDTTTDIKAEQESMRQNRWLARKGWSVNGGFTYPDYGRRTPHVRDVTFKQDR